MTDNDRNASRPERPATKDQDPLLELTRLFNLDFNANGNSPARQPDTSANLTPRAQVGSQNDADLPFLEDHPQGTGSLDNARQTEDNARQTDNENASGNADLDFLPQDDNLGNGQQQHEPDLPFNELYDTPSFTPQARAPGTPIEPPAGFSGAEFDTLPDLPIGDEPSAPAYPTGQNYNNQTQNPPAAGNFGFSQEQTQHAPTNTNNLNNPRDIDNASFVSPENIAQPDNLQNFAHQRPQETSQNTNSYQTTSGNGRFPPLNQAQNRQNPVFDEMSFDKELENLLVNDPLPAFNEPNQPQQLNDAAQPRAPQINNNYNFASATQNDSSGSASQLGQPSGGSENFNRHVAETNSGVENNAKFSPAQWNGASPSSTSPENYYAGNAVKTTAPLPYTAPQNNQNSPENDFLNGDDPFGFDDVFSDNQHQNPPVAQTNSGSNTTQQPAAQSSDPFGLEDLSTDENIIVNPPVEQNQFQGASVDSDQSYPESAETVNEQPPLPPISPEPEPEFREHSEPQQQHAPGPRNQSTDQSSQNRSDYPAQPVEQNYNPEEHLAFSHEEQTAAENYPANTQQTARNLEENNSNLPPDVDTYKFADEIVEQTEPVDVPEIPYPAEENTPQSDALENEFADVFSVGNKQETPNTPKEQDDFFAEAYAQSGYNQKQNQFEQNPDVPQGQYGLQNSGNVYAEDNPAYAENEQTLIGTNAPFAEMQNQPRPKSLAKKLTVGGVALFIFLGGGYAAMKYFLPSQGDGASTVIHADNAPYKVQAEQTNTNNESQNNQDVYNQANGETDDKGNQEKLVDHSETPEDLTALNDAASYADSSNVEDAIAAASNQSVPTREVQSVVVNPDGTISPTTNSAPSQVEASGNNSEKSQSDNLANVQNGSKQSQSKAKASSEPEMSETDSELTKIINEDAQSNKDADNATSKDLSSSQNKLSGINTVSSPKPQQQAQPVETAEQTTQKPAAFPNTASTPLTKVEPKAAPITASVGAGGYYVQIASQPTQESATASMNKAKSLFGSLIGSLPLSIQPASIPGKGTYYRVRVQVGPRDNAVSLCEKIKSQNGSCFVGK